RGRDMPPPVLLPRSETIFGLVDGVDETILALTSRFWPGPLTIIADAQPSLDWDLGDTHGTVAVRMPDDEYALSLLSRTGPLAVSSANISGRPAATTADEAQEMLGDDVDIYVDGGARESGMSSTIIDLSGDVPRIARRGPISAEQLREIVPELIDLDGCVRAYLFILLVTALVAYLLTPMVKRVAERGRIFSPLRERDVHSVPTRRLGGVAMFGGLLVGLVFASQTPFLQRIFVDTGPIIGVAGAAGLLCLLGVVDDIWDLHWMAKLAGQALAAGFMAIKGVALLSIPF